MKINKFKMATAGLIASNLAMATNVAFAEVEIDPKIKTAVNGILSVLQIAGIVVAVAMLTWAGFKFLTAGAGEKAKAKDQLVPIAIGSLLVVLAPAIATTVWNAIGGKNEWGDIGGN